MYEVVGLEWSAASSEQLSKMTLLSMDGLYTVRVVNGSETISSNYELMQGHGRTDNHGTDIYEGDIIRTDNEQQYAEPVEEHYYGTIYYDGEKAMYRIKQPDSTYAPALSNDAIVSIEVIGNIWQQEAQS